MECGGEKAVFSMRCLSLHIQDCNTPKIASTSSAFGYFAARSGFCAPRIVKRSARAHRWKRLGFESGIPRYARRSRGICTLFLAQMHPRPSKRMPAFGLAAPIVFWSVHALIARRRFSGPPAAGIVIDRKDAALAIAAALRDFFFATLRWRRRWFARVILRWDVWQQSWERRKIGSPMRS